MPRMRKGEQKAYYSLSSIGARFNAALKRAGIRRRNPYHTRHTFACWLLSAGANPSFIASQMGHENAQMVYEVYGAWIEEMNGEQVLMLTISWHAEKFLPLLAPKVVINARKSIKYKERAIQPE